jgi:uncharacterized iron-regulated membrane protein
MRRLRTVVFWLHLAAGVLTGLVILAMSATGVVLAYQRQLTERAVAADVPARVAGASRLPLDTLLARAAAAAPGARVTAVTVRADPAAPVAVSAEVGRGSAAVRRTVWVDPVSGRVLPGSPRLQGVFRTTERIHRSLALGQGARSPVGTALTGVSNLVFLFLLVSGLYLWVPRRWTRRAVAAVAVPALGARGRARDWNWHHVLGLWAAPGLLVVVGSAAFLSYEWPQRLVARAAGARTAAPERAGVPRPAAAGSAAAPAPRLPLDTLAARALAEAGAAAPGAWYSVQLRLPAAGGAGGGGGAVGREVTATVSTVRALRPDRRVTVPLDPATGSPGRVQRYAALDAGRKARGWARFLHTGEALGVAGQTVAMLVSLAGVGLVATGLALAVRRASRALRGGEAGGVSEGPAPA